MKSVAQIAFAVAWAVECAGVALILYALSRVNWDMLSFAIPFIVVTLCAPLLAILTNQKEKNIATLLLSLVGIVISGILTLVLMFGIGFTHYAW